MKPNLNFFIFAIMGVVMIGGTASALQNSQGEMWRMRVSLEMPGFSMPTQTIEVCVPADQNPDEAMMMQQNNSGDCQITNLQRSGSKTSADIRCTGKDAMSGHFEIEMAGDTMRGTMTVNAEGITMTTKYESTKLGKACVPQTAASSAPAQQAKTPAAKSPDSKMFEMPDMCEMMLGQTKSDDLAGQANIFFGSTLKTMSAAADMDLDCTKHASFRNYCSALQTSPEGFQTLERIDQEGGLRDYQTGENTLVLPASVKACGLGSEAELQSKLLPIAENEGRWSYLLRYGGDEYWSKLVETTKKECSGRAFTNATSQRYMNLCGSYGSAISRNDRRGALAAAGCREENRERNICVGFGGVIAKTKAQPAGGGAAPKSSGQSEENESAKPKSPAQKIRGILGR